MPIRWITRNGEKILQYYTWVINKTSDGKLIETYEWQDVPLKEETISKEQRQEDPIIGIMKEMSLEDLKEKYPHIKKER